MIQQPYGRKIAVHEYGVQYNLQHNQNANKNDHFALITFGQETTFMAVLRLSLSIPNRKSHPKMAHIFSIELNWLV